MKLVVFEESGIREAELTATIPSKTRTLHDLKTTKQNYIEDEFISMAYLGWDVVLPYMLINAVSS